MKGVLKNGRVILPFSQKLFSRKFGKKKGDKLVLSPEEAAYLVSKGSLEVLSDSGVLEFEDIFPLTDPIKFFVYEDLRNRGIAVEFNSLNGYIPLHESEIIETRKLERFNNKKLAIVDSEGEISYFLVKKFDERGKHTEDLKKFKAKFANGFFVTDNRDLFRKYFYGTEKGNRVVLSLFEALFLIEKGVMVTDKSFEEIFDYGKSTIKDFEKKYLIYKDLRLRNFMVKTGFKFGSEFRVYEEIKSVSELGHSKYLVKIKNRFTAFELAGDVRLATAVNKTIVYPILKRQRVDYIAVRRTKF